MAPRHESGAPMTQPALSSPAIGRELLGLQSGHLDCTQLGADAARGYGPALLNGSSGRVWCWGLLRIVFVPGRLDRSDACTVSHVGRDQVAKPSILD